MRGVDHDERIARITLSRIAEPGDMKLGGALREHGAVEALNLLRERRLPVDRQGHRRARLDSADPYRDMDVYERHGVRPIFPGDEEWPTQLDDLGDGSPYMLWVQGAADLRRACLRSVSVVGARAASGYGNHVATELAALLAERGWTTISGGAYGIDAAAHRGAMAAGGPTAVVLACGLDVGYPRGHHGLFARVAEVGALVAELPPGAAPSRPRFLVRNRVIAALSRGTVVVEAALRSGALNTAGHAADLLRSVMAVPGPVTSTMSAGCHDLLRAGGAVCVTDADEIIDQVGVVGDDMVELRRGPARPRDALDDDTTRVLESLPTRGSCGPATIGVAAGVDLATTLRCLGELATRGFVERCDEGWRLAGHDP